MVYKGGGYRLSPRKGGYRLSPRQGGIPAEPPEGGGYRLSPLKTTAATLTTTVEILFKYYLNFIMSSLNEHVMSSCHKLKFSNHYRVSQKTWEFSDEFDIVFLNNSLI